MSVESTFIQSARDRRLCELVDQEGNLRLVEPYMVYTSAKGKRIFHCYQVGGYSASGETSGWKNLSVDSFVKARETEYTFKVRDEYFPFNKDLFPTVHFAVPPND